VDGTSALSSAKLIASTDEGADRRANERSLLLQLTQKQISPLMTVIRKTILSADICAWEALF
jgi:hypothetical protein